MRRELVDRHLRAAAERRAIPSQLADVLHHTIALARHALAVHVAGQRDESRFGKAARAASGVIVEARASMNDENSRTAPWCRVPHEHAVERLVTIAVADVLGLNHECEPLSGIL
jgi:hypothetical protein